MMKIRFIAPVLLLLSLSMTAQTHISIDDPTTWSSAVLSPYVGQEVIFDVPMIVCTNANGNYSMSPWRKFQPENQGFIGTAEYNETVRINSSCMFSLGGVSGYHRCGEKIYNLRATVNSATSLTMKSGTWNGNTRTDLEKGLPDLGNYRLLVCGFNLENYFVANMGSMGAKNYSEHQDQRAKVSKALMKINADIFGLVELEQGNDAIGEIVSDLNKNIPGRNYKYFSEGASGAFQKTDYVYDANKVEPIGTPAGSDVEVQNRKKMVCFRELATGEKFIYSINHFKAMNTGGADRRENEARAVIKLYNSYRQNANIRENDLLVMGDLNCYAKTAPISVFTNNGMIDLHRSFHADSSYSYMFSGLASYIDHAICNEALYRQITGMAAYHINSDEDDKYTYDKSSDRTMFRCSDHDPVMVGLALDSTLSQSFEPYVSTADMSADSLAFYYIYTTNEDPMVYFDIYSINGLPICSPKPIVYEGDLLEKHAKYYTLKSENPNLPDEVKAFLPLPAGIYILHFYYKGTVASHKLIVR